MKNCDLVVVDRPRSRYPERYARCRRRPKYYSVLDLLAVNALPDKLYLFNLREEFINVAIKFELANVTDRHVFFRPDFRRVENIEVKVILCRKN
jgi:hypothetical protein